jgi:hypothetical protein
MKQKNNITLLILVLSIPFALSQTRKAIPAGRYEALSGVKVSHSLKGGESALTKDSQGLFWSEVSKHIPQGRNENSFFNSGVSDINVKSLLSSKGVLESKTLDKKVNILLSDNIGRDDDLFKMMKTKGSLIILKEKKSLQEVLAYFSNFELLVYQVENDSHYFLLKKK